MRKIILGETRTGDITVNNLSYSTATFRKDVWGADTAEIVIPIANIPAEYRKNPELYFVEDETYIAGIDDTFANPVRWAGPVRVINPVNENGTITVICGGIAKIFAQMPIVPILKRDRIESDADSWTVTGTPAAVISEILTVLTTEDTKRAFLQSLILPTGGTGTLTKTFILSELNMFSDFIEELNSSYEGFEVLAVPRYATGSTTRIVWEVKVGDTTNPHINKTMATNVVNIDGNDGVTAFSYRAGGTKGNNWFFAQSDKTDATNDLWIDLQSTATQKPAGNTRFLTLAGKERFSSELTTAELNTQSQARLADSAVLAKTYNVSIFDKTFLYTDRLGATTTFTGSKRLQGLNDTVRITGLAWDFNDPSSVELTVQPANLRIYPRVPQRHTDTIDKAVDDGIKTDAWKTPITGKPSWGTGGTGGGTGLPAPDFPSFTPQNPYGAADPIFSSEFTAQQYDKHIAAQTVFAHKYNFYGLNRIGFSLMKTYQGTAYFEPGVIKLRRGEFIRAEDGTVTSSPTITELATIPNSMYASKRIPKPGPNSVDEFLGSHTIWNSLFVVNDYLVIYFIENMTYRTLTGGKQYDRIITNTWTMESHLDPTTGDLVGPWVLGEFLNHIDFMGANFFAWGNNIAVYGEDLDKVAIVGEFYYPEDHRTNKTVATKVFTKSYKTPDAQVGFTKNSNVPVKTEADLFGKTGIPDTVSTTYSSGFLYATNMSYRGEKSQTVWRCEATELSLGNWEKVASVNVNAMFSGGATSSVGIGRVNDYVVWFAGSDDSETPDPEVSMVWGYNKIGFDGGINEKMKLGPTMNSFANSQRLSPDAYSWYTQTDSDALWSDTETGALVFNINEGHSSRLIGITGYMFLFQGASQMNGGPYQEIKSVSVKLL